MDIPETAADLTPEWLTAALHESGAIGDAVVSAADAEQINVGQGFTGRVFHVRLGYERPAPNAPASVVVKLPSTDSEIRGVLGELGVGATEVGFYRDLAPEAGLPTPRMYYGEHDAASASYVLLLEDLAPAPVGDSVAGCPPEQAEALVLQLATLHARWWNEPRLEEFPWLATPTDTAAAQQRIAATAWQRSSAALGDRIDADAAAAIEGMIDRWPAIAAHLSGPPYTLTHGDFKLDNLCFPDGPLGPMVAFDWQLARRGRGAIDLAYFLPGVDIRADPEGTTPRLIGRYHEALLMHGVEGYSLEQLSYDHRAASFHFVYIANVVGLLDMSSARGQELVAGVMRLVGSLARGLDLVALLERDF